MTSVVEICNSALNKIGANTINSLSEDSQEARLCKAQFTRLRDALLRSHPWNFALHRAVLARLADPPAFDFAYQYQLPGDCLRLLQLQDPATRFRIEGRQLLTDAEAARVLYIRRVTDPNRFDALFGEALATRLAAEIAFAVANSRSLGEEMLKLARDAIRDAKTRDAQEGTPAVVAGSSWLDSRV